MNRAGKVRPHGNLIFAGLNIIMELFFRLYVCVTVNHQLNSFYDETATIGPRDPIVTPTLLVGKLLAYDFFAKLP